MRSVILPKVSVLKIAWVHVLAASIGEGRGVRKVFSLAAPDKRMECRAVAYTEAPRIS
jgi:hypothetical protein